MSVAWDRHPLAGGVFLLVLAWALITLNTVRALQAEGTLFRWLVDVSIPLALALVLVVGAFVVSVYGLRDQALRISAWTALGTVSVTVAVGLNIVGIDTVDPNTTLLVFMLTNAAGGGAALGLLIGVYDAHQQRLQTQLEREGEKARALSQRLSVVNRVLRHDIRNHAQVIEGYTETMVDEKERPDAVATHIREASRQLFQTAENVRQLQPLLDGAEMDCRQFDLVETVRRTGEAAEAEHGIDIEYDLPDAQPVYAPSLLDQAIRQLLANAAVHNDTATPRAEVCVRTTDDDRLPVELTVGDNGPGIPDSERLVATDGEETQLEHSSGLGLWFVKWIVDGAGGEFEFTTPEDPEVGTVVRIRLPAEPG